MTNDSIRGMLVDYAEGILDSEIRIAFEEQLRKSPELQAELATIRATFEILQRQEEVKPDIHYFNNFVPNLRQKIERGNQFPLFMIPSWLSPAVAPAAAIVIVVTMALMYFILQPGSENAAFRSMIRFAERIEIDDASSFAATPLVTFNDDMLASIFISADSRDDRSLLPSAMFSMRDLDEFAISADQIVSDLHDQEIDIIVTQLTQRSVQ